MPPWTPSPTAPRDRDPATVTAGLTKLDPCGLVDPVAAGFPPAEHFSGDGSCRYLTRTLHQMDVELGARFVETNRHIMAPLTVNGYKTYWGDFTIAREYHSTCYLDAPVSFEKSIEVRVKKETGENDAFDSCAVARATADSLVKRVVATTGPNLLYKSDEPDQSAEGGCIHYLNLGTTIGCRPYRPATVPSSPQELLRAGHTQADVSCAAAMDSVHRILGEAMIPVVFGQNCVFVEPTHAVRFGVIFSDEYVPNGYGTDPAGSGEVIEGRATTTIAGHPTIMIPGGGKNRDGTPDLTRLEREMYVSPGHDANQPGVVMGRLIVQHPRGTAPDTPADNTKIPLLAMLLTALMTKHFPN